LGQVDGNAISHQVKDSNDLFAWIKVNKDSL